MGGLTARTYPVFPAVLLLAGDDEYFLATGRLAEPGGVEGGNVALAVGGRREQAEVADAAMLRSAAAARGLAEEHDVFGHRAHRQQQAHAGFGVVDDRELADGAGGEHDRGGWFGHRGLADAAQGAVDFDPELLAAQVPVLAEPGVAGGVEGGGDPAVAGGKLIVG